MSDTQDTEDNVFCNRYSPRALTSILIIFSIFYIYIVKTIVRYREMIKEFSQTGLV